MEKSATLTADRLLAEDWSASAYVRELQNGQAAAQNILFILQDQELRKLEPLIKVRLLLAPLFLRKQERDSIKGTLQVLADKLCLDDDDWVKVTAYAVGRYEGHLDLVSVANTSRAVRQCILFLSDSTCTCSAHLIPIWYCRWKLLYQSCRLACQQQHQLHIGPWRYAAFKQSCSNSRCCLFL